MTALQGLRDAGRLQPEQKILIIGASGGVGTVAVQIAKSFGADVTRVCGTRNAETDRSERRGPRHRLHPGGLHPDWAEVQSYLPVGVDSFAVRLRARAHRHGDALPSSGESSGCWIGPVDRIIRAIALSPFVSQKLGTFVTIPGKEDLQFLRELIEADKVRPVIDRRYSLRDAPDAIRYHEEGHARGNVIITV